MWRPPLEAVQHVEGGGEIRTEYHSERSGGIRDADDSLAPRRSADGGEVRLVAVELEWR